MQQADAGRSPDGARAPTGNVHDVTATRRGLLGGAAALLAASAAPCGASTNWSAGDWIAVWHDLGCGARLDGRGSLQLTPRRGREDEAGALLGQLALPGRTASVTALLRQVEDEDAAVRAARECAAIDAAFVSADDDAAGHAAWDARADAAYERLAATPARTGKGLAAKLRVATDWNGTDLGERLTAQVMRQLEHMA